MRKNIANFGLCWLAVVALAPLWTAACSGDALSLGGSAGASGSGGNDSSSGGGGAAAAGSSSQETCKTTACGPQLGIPSQICADGSTGGPTGRCLKNADGVCGWEVRECPPPGSGGSATGGSTGMGGASGVQCGGETCKAEQVCCGPAECGFCISKLSGAACPATCSGGDGGAGGAPDCEQLLADVTKTQAAAQACNPASAKPTLECAGTLDGLCCPILVESASATTPTNAAYLDALKSYKASCAHFCPAIACLKPQPGNCMSSSATSGKCSP